MTTTAKTVSPRSVFGYFRQVQYFLPLPSSVGLPLSPTKERDTLNRRMWWIALEVRSLYRCTGFIPAQPSSQPWIGAADQCVWSIIRWGVTEALWEGCLCFCTGRVAWLASFTCNRSYLGLRFSTLMWDVYIYILTHYWSCWIMLMGKLVTYKSIRMPLGVKI